MTPEEKVAFLKEAGVWDVIGFPTCIDKLFELVAANEREACAKVCEQQDKSEYPRTFIDECFSTATAVCAAAIRARNNKE